MYKVVIHNPDGTTHEEDEIFETEEEARIWRRAVQQLQNGRGSPASVESRGLPAQ
jgi:hypothetical protein